jgi:hypothetical protein
MRNTHPIFLSTLLLLTSCTTLDESFRLGSAAGALTGVAATYAAGSSSGRTPTMEDAAVGASIGIGLGLITSYFIHQAVATDRQESTRQTEIYFGDLPPSPFIFPSTKRKGGQ